MDLKLEMYETGMPKSCVIVLYLGCGVEFGDLGGVGGRGRGGGGGVWYVFGGKMVVACKSALFNFLGLEFFDGQYACVGVILDFREGR
jgi:hypothetical protein